MKLPARKSKLNLLELPDGSVNVRITTINAETNFLKRNGSIKFSSVNEFSYPG